MEELGEKWAWKNRMVGLVVAVMLLAGCSSMMNRQYLEEGTAALQKGDYRMAVSSFEKALEAKETKEAGDLVLGTKAAIIASDHLRDGKFEEAETFAEEAISLAGKGEAHDALRVFAEETRKQAVAEKDRKRLIQELEKARGEMEKGMLDDAFERASKIAKDSGAIQYGVVSSAQELLNEILDSKKKGIFQKEKQRKEEEARRLEEERKKEEEWRLQQQKQEEEKRRAEENRKEEKSSLTKEDAVQLVIEMTGMTPSEFFFVEYDHHTPEGHYVIQLYEVVIDDPETREGHTATYGWYGVVPDTGEVYDYMQR